MALGVVNHAYLLDFQVDKKPGVTRYHAIYYSLFALLVSYIVTPRRERN